MSLDNKNKTTLDCLRRESASQQEAITQAGGLRFRAIILTSLTTFGGLMPMILERSLQAKFLIPMAVSLGYGVLFATVITLLLIPCLYLILEDGHTVIEKLKTRMYHRETATSSDN